MLISETNLYKQEWLSLVFKNRNQQYGAYELRSHYANVMSGAIGITIFVVAAFSITTTLISRNTHTVEPIVHVTHVDNTVHVIPPRQPKDRIEKPETAKAAPKSTPVATQRFVEPKPVPDQQAEEIKPLDPTMAVGQENVKTPALAAENLPVIDDPQGVPGGTGNIPDNSIHDGNGVGLDVLPQPVGGENAWARFLQKNLKYPQIAQEQGAQGKVYMSFVIEKDGHLSNITVERKAGFGFDEEALRVLKLAPAWKPGAQNGQPVRVRYTVPLNFQLGDQ